MTYEELMDFDAVMAVYEPVVGLEVHVELNTASKMFCGCSTAFGAAPNSQTCPICLGLPGSLPVINATAVESAVRIGLALNCSIAERCRMARKNYFYPDMTKNFQTSQSDEPLCFNGSVVIELADGESFTIAIERAHMEEDTGKALHVGGATGRIQGAEYSLMDYNRSSVGLIEIVTKPIRGAGERAGEVARAYVTYLRDMIRALGVSDVRMEQGSLRCDVNLSLMPKGSTTLGTRTETKNVNSLRSIEKAVLHEICRQGAILTSGKTVKQETRHWHEDGTYTSPGRSKEHAEDYRYFPEPDLVPVVCPPSWVDELRATIPQAPSLRRAALQAAWGYSPLEMRDVVAAEALDLIEATVAAGCAPQSARKWWMSQLLRQANAREVSLDELPISPQAVAELQNLVDKGILNDNLARTVIEAVLAGEGMPGEIVQARQLGVVNDQATLDEAVAQAIEANPEIADKIRAGKVQAAGALVGAVMKDLGGKADAGVVRELILAKLA
ncbi:MAG: Asp-tRNA(Asn)/Glu-tRNA(Gln) amidotransferase subunit GatB [Propionibacteriaceae bacterium]|jgi:aspartyl-tRNA(Asn)/glutamyl-tRNA(Gln) amidotransferase subunit B|nr:Asp-tRNA(Asn)/Glu-tRNA(Gln) amidotransferase subunit GatB [Propionibacteriaceae bacterium]